MNIMKTTFHSSRFTVANSRFRLGEMGDASFTQRALLSHAISGSTRINTLKTVTYCLSESTTIRELATLVVDESNLASFKAHYLC
jgi:hypothetical protein